MNRRPDRSGRASGPVGSAVPAGSDGVTLFVTTHYMDEAERCSSVGYIYNARLIVSGGPDELKHARLMAAQGKVRLEILCRPLVKTFNVVKALPYVRDVTIFGQALHVASDASDAAARLADDLQRAGVNLRAMREIEPTLEDVFVTLTQASLQEEENRAALREGVESEFEEEDDAG